MIPLTDDNPTTITPVVTYGLIATCVAVFLWQVSLSPVEAQQAVYAYGFIPAVLFDAVELPPRLARIPAELSVLTSMFLHGGWMHLIGNMLYLWIFGDNVEEALGRGRFIVFYVLSGIAAAMAQAYQDPASVVPMIGASGAIGGVLGGYMMLFPHARVLVLIPLGFFTQLIQIPAVIVLGLWFVLQFVQSAMTVGEQGGVAFWAHIGGFVAGALLVIPLRQKHFPLFAQKRPAPPRAGRARWDRRGRGPWG